MPVSCEPPCDRVGGQEGKGIGRSAERDRVMALPGPASRGFAEWHTRSWRTHQRDVTEESLHHTTRFQPAQTLTHRLLATRPQPFHSRDSLLAMRRREMRQICRIHDAEPSASGGEASSPAHPTRQHRGPHAKRPTRHVAKETLPVAFEYLRAPGRSPRMNVQTPDIGLAIDASPSKAAPWQRDLPNRRRDHAKLRQCPHQRRSLSPWTLRASRRSRPSRSC
jgi:hypothetical protein